MLWHVFENGDYCHHNDPRAPGVYLGSIEIPDKWVNGININIQAFDLHLRKTKRHAYGETYNKYLPAFEIKNYGGFTL